MTDPLNWLWTTTLLTGLVFSVVRLAEFTFGRRIPAGARVAAYALVFLRILTPATSTHGTAVLPQEVLAVSVTVAELSPSPSVPNVERAAPRGDELPWLSFLYGAGVLAVLGLVGVAGRRERSALKDSVLETGVDGAPLWIHATAGPCVVGILRPRVVVPRGFGELPVSVQRCVLAHERAHIKGRDPWIMLVLRIAVAFSWPIVPCWLAAARIRSLLEVRADAAAIGSQGLSPTVYGRALIGMASLRPLGPLPALSGYRSLTERVVAVAAGSSTRRGSGGLLLGLGLAAAACSVPAEPPSVARPLTEPTLEALPASAGSESLVQLEASDVLRIARPEHAWATPLAAQELVAVAERLRARRPGAVLTVGDASRRGGGRLMPHRTHREGREVDIPWPVDAQGNLLNAQAWELLEALAHSGRIEAIVIDGELHEGIREAAIASGVTPEAIAGVLPEPSTEQSYPSLHVHVRFRASGAS